MPDGDDSDNTPLPSGPVNWSNIDAYIQQSIIKAFGPKTIQALARNILSKVDNDSAIQLFHPATVIADQYDGSNHTATLQMDNDPNGTITYAAVLVPVTLFPGQRIMVWFDKPHIAYVIGIATLPMPPICRISNHCAPVDGG